ncbi:hypothetical protein RFF05_17725 [Bengtsoniella intestinalis]|uniref:hypothetical protein n=1 Tax=Bengtsoniella intestinalis TaxID=3073143 RepID=UPI00391F5A97
MTVTFFGHSMVNHREGVKVWLELVIPELIAQGATVFYSGGYGGFDALVAQVLQQEKQRCPHIESVLVLAYLQDHPYAKDYDSTTYPELERVPKRFAILKRNQWMVGRSDVVVAYVNHGVSNAVKTLEYAKRKKKPVILYPNTTPQPLPSWV